MKNSLGRPYGSGEKYGMDDITTTRDYMPSIISPSDSDEDIPFTLDQDPDSEEDDAHIASKIYTEEEEEEVSDSRWNDIIRIGMPEEFLDQIPQDKLNVILDNAKGLNGIIEGVDWGFGYKANGIEISTLTEIIKAVEVDKLDLFFSNAFNVLNFADYNKSVSLVELFKLDREFIILFINNPHPFSNIIKDTSLNDVVKVGYEKASYAICYFSYKDRNDLISFSMFMRLLEFNPDAIKDLFPARHIRGRTFLSPFENSKKNALEKVNNINIRSKEIPELLVKAHMSDWCNLLLCDILFSKVSDLIEAINKHPSSKYEERGMDYIIKLYEEQSQIPNATKGNNPDVKGKFCGILLFCRSNVISILDKNVFSLDDMQAICNEYPDYLKEILGNQRIILDWDRAKDQFYEDIGLENGDQFFADLKEKKPVLFVFYMKFRQKIREFIVKRAATLSDIEDIYLISINSLDRLFKDKDLILKWSESRADFYEAIGLKERDTFFVNKERRRMYLFCLVLKFQDEILYMHQESIMNFQDMVYIYDRNPLILEIIFNNSNKIEWLMKDEKYKSMDDILNLFSTNGKNCLKNVDVINGGLIDNERASLSEIARESSELYKKGEDSKSSSEKKVSFNQSMRVVFFDNREEPMNLILDRSKNPQPEASTALPSINLEKSSPTNFSASIQNAINTSLPFIENRDRRNTTVGMSR